MKVARSVFTGVLLGAAVAFVGALLRPRRWPNPSGYDPTAATGSTAGP